MPSIRDGLLAALGLLSAAFAVLWWLHLRREGARMPSLPECAIGFVTDAIVNDDSWT